MLNRSLENREAQIACDCLHATQFPKSFNIMGLIKILVEVTGDMDFFIGFVNQPLFTTAGLAEVKESCSKKFGIISLIHPPSLNK